MELMDMDGSDLFTATADTGAAYDPFKELEGLLDIPSITASTLQKGSLDLLSLHNSISRMETTDGSKVGLIGADELLVITQGWTGILRYVGVIRFVSHIL